MRELPFPALLEWLDPRRPPVGVSFLPDRIATGDIYVAYSPTWARPVGDIPLALARGAAAIVAEDAVPADFSGSSAALCTVPSTTRAYAQLVAAGARTHLESLRVYGVTGTKGKTTTAHLIWSVLSHAGYRAGLIATGSAAWPGGTRETGCTTPEPWTLHEILGAMAAAHVSHVVLEVSSIGIAEERLTGITCHAAVWTNTGSDHVAYHRGVERYIAAKARLFTDHLGSAGLAAVNADDPPAMAATASVSGRRRTFGMRVGDTRAKIVSQSPAGMVLRIGGWTIRTSLVGVHNAYNVCAAAAVAAESGIPSSAIASGVAAVASVEGRFQRLSQGSLDVVVDYAHTPESVEAVLRTIAALWPGRRLVTVLGAGGETDRCKRAPMARCAAQLSDLLLLTEDNSRNEPLGRILDDLSDGACGLGDYRVVARRAAAIREAVWWALPDGVVAVLGRGAEKNLVSGGSVQRFDDTVFVRRLMSSLESHADHQRISAR